MPAAVLRLQVPPGVRASRQHVDGCWEKLGLAFGGSSLNIPPPRTAFDSAGTQVSSATDHEASGFATGTASWTIAGLTLPPGAIQVTVTALDTAGTQFSTAIAVTYVPDTRPPTVAITSMTSAGSFIASSNTINLGGTASDDGGVTQVTWTTVHGGQWHRDVASRPHALL